MVPALRGEAFRADLHHREPDPFAADLRRSPTGAGPGYSYLAGLLIFVLAVYLVAVAGVALYAMVELWPHPTPAGEPAAADTPKTDTTATDTAATDTAKTDSTTSDAKKTDTTTSDAKKTNAAATDAKKTDAKKTDATTSEKKRPAAGKGEIPIPTDEAIKARQARLCGTDKRAGRMSHARCNCSTNPSGATTRIRGPRFGAAAASR
jgi:hypothetical protein